MEQVTSAEWSVLEYLWTHSPASGREVSRALAESVGWSRSTTLTMLRRMSEKGLIACSLQDGMNVYSPLLSRDAATQSQTQSFLQRIYHGSISSMLSAFTQKQSLTQKEIDELFAILMEVQPRD